MQRAFWGLAAKAAARAGNMDQQIQYLEKALSLPGDAQLTHGVLRLDADQLWDAYLARGKRIGNDEQKLLGNDEDWYFPATEAIRDRSAARTHTIRSTWRIRYQSPAASCSP